mmetsp:Transcript_53805/g.156370  ORF Transcript_53805/g.156370 Transcript_53805/m.156370 type:complete len:85 (+) Transcript_53805:431-685(+)
MRGSRAISIGVDSRALGGRSGSHAAAEGVARGSDEADDTEQQLLVAPPLLQPPSRPAAAGLPSGAAAPRLWMQQPDEPADAVFA